MYTALYDESGNLLGRKVDKRQDSFVVLGVYDKYTIKAFLWDENMKRICLEREKDVIYDKMGAYMFVHFTGTESSAEHEQIYFSVSKDGRTWDVLNQGNQVLTSNIGEGGVRDPYIVRSPKEDKFYLIATDLSIYNRKKTVDEKTAWAQCKNVLEDNPNPGSKKMVVWESEDLVNWSDARLADAAPDDAGCYWAPECIWDEEKNAYMVFGASCTSTDGYTLLRLYRSYTTDFVNFTEPELYMDESKSNLSVFDTTIIKEGQKYYRIYKTDRIKISSADSLSGEWTIVNTNIDSIASSHEGPTICKMNGENLWILMLDYLKSHGGYQPFITEDLDAGSFKSTASEVFFPTEVKYRHGAIMPITYEEYDKLVGVYGTK